MNELTEIKDKQVEAQELDQLIKIHANMAWQNLMESARCLKQMRDTKLYLELGYESFGDYSQQSLNIKERQAYTYISAYENLGERFLQSNANLGITKLALLAAVPPLERDEVMRENDIAGMTVEQVKALVAENNNKGEQLEMLTDERDAIKSELEETEKTAAIYEERIAELEIELEKERTKPVEVAVREPDPEEIKKIRAEAEAAAKKSADKEIKAAKKQLEDKHKTELEEIAQESEKAKAEAVAEYKKQLSEIDAEKAEAVKRAESLEKQLAVASSAETVKFQFYFDALQQDVGKICESIRKLRNESAESAEKFRSAMIKYTDIIRNSLEQS